MELLKKNIHMSRRKAYGENRMTLSEDFNIPDKKPDAAGLIQKRGEVKLEEVHHGRPGAAFRNSGGTYPVCVRRR